MTSITYPNGRTRTIEPDDYRTPFFDGSNRGYRYNTLAAWAADAENVNENGYNGTVLMARAIIEEAYAEHAARYPETPVTVDEQPSDEHERIARALGANEAQLGKLRAIIEARVAAERERDGMRDELRRLRDEQITDGSDPRLADFWENAKQQATDAGYCSEYDRMAQLLGGPARPTPGHVHITYTVDVSIDVDDIDDYDYSDDDVYEAVREAARNGEGSWEEGEAHAD